MFFLVGFSLYLLLNVYVWMRLRSYMHRPVHRRIFTVCYILLFAAFPVSEIIAHAPGGGMSPLLLIGFYSLPVLMYLLFMVIAGDIMAVINRFTHLVSHHKAKSRTYRIAKVAVMTILPLIIVGAGSINFRTLQVNPYHIGIERKSSSVSRLRIVMIADVHLNDLTDTAFIESAVGRINSLHPDLVLIPGDLLEGNRRGRKTAEFERMFRGIDSTWGTYASLGNHDISGGGPDAAFFTNAGITLLDDTSVTIKGAFTVAGRSDAGHDGRRIRAPLEKVLSRRGADLPLILLDHRPVDFVPVSNAGVDIMLSGHTHHGQFFPFNYITEKMYMLSWGHRQMADTHFFVTSGIRAWGPPVKTIGSSEIMVIDVDLK